MCEKILSLIIPVYNTEKYLEQCLESVFHQMDESLEIIIVNDGSADDSKRIIESYQSDFDFIFVDKINGGLSSARNAGIEIATGKYIAFLDSDDLWFEDAYSKIKIVIRDNDFDCFAFDFRNISSDGLLIDICTNNSDVNLRGDSFYNLSVKECLAKKNEWFAWRFLFKTQLYKINLFDENRRFEDQLLLPWLVNLANSVMLVDEYLVYYRQNENGITKNLRLSDLDDSEFCVARYLKCYQLSKSKSKSKSKFWCLVLSSIYLSHVSKCARLFYDDPEKATSSYELVSKVIPFHVINKSGCIKAILYYYSFGLMFKRLIQRVKKEVKSCWE